MLREAPTTSIIPNTTVFPAGPTLNTVDNNLGQINFSASVFPPTTLSGTFTVATIRFRAKGAVTMTPVTFVRSGARLSDILMAGASLNPSLSNGGVSITNGLTLSGRVSLQDRGAPGDPRWSTQLFRTEFGVTTAGVTLFAAGSATPLFGFTATTDALGNFSIPVPGVTPGLYDILVKGSDTLANERFAVSLPSAAPINFGTLLVGDTNGDDVVNAADVSYMVPSFLKVLGDPAFRPYADVNKDGAVNGADVSTLVPNFLSAGPITVSAAAALQRAASAEAKAASATGASLSLVPAVRTGFVGGVMTMDIMANTGTGAPDTVQVDLNFDPNYVQVVNAAGSATTSIDLLNSTVLGNVYYNSVDNAAGHVDVCGDKLRGFAGRLVPSSDDPLQDKGARVGLPYDFRPQRRQEKRSVPGWLYDQPDPDQRKRDRRPSSAQIPAPLDPLSRE